MTPTRRPVLVCRSGVEVETVGSKLDGLHTPSPEGFAQRLWQGVLAQFIVEDLAGRRPLGVVAAFAPDHRNRNVQIAVAAMGERDIGAALFLEGVELFVDYLFLAFDFRKILGFVLEPNIDGFTRLLGPVLRHEGILESHEYVRGTWVDVHVVAVHRDDWRRRPPAFASGRGGSFAVPQDRAEFLRCVEETLELEPLPPDDAMLLRLREDLGVDSLGLLQLLDVIEGPDAGELPDQALASIVTLGDAYHFACALHERSVP